MLNNPVSGVDPDGHWPWDKPKPLPPPVANHQHTLTIREVSGQNGNSLGHITVQVDKGKEVGFGPQKDMTKGQLAENKSVPGKVEPLAAGAKTLDAVTVHITSKEAQAAPAKITQGPRIPVIIRWSGEAASILANPF